MIATHAGVATRPLRCGQLDLQKTQRSCKNDRGAGEPAPRSQLTFRLCEAAGQIDPAPGVVSDAARALYFLLRFLLFLAVLPFFLPFFFAISDS